MIKLMDKSQTYEVMDVWLRASLYSLSFVESDFWKKHYDYVKEKYIDKNDTFVYVSDGKVIGFACVGADNMIEGLFVDPDYQNKGIGGELINFLKTEYPILQAEIYAKNRKSLEFVSRLGFVIDGAVRNEYNNEVMYSVFWNG